MVKLTLRERLLCWHHFPIGCLIVVGDQADHCCVVCKLNDSVGHAGVGEQGEQEETKYIALWGPSVDQRGRYVFAYHLGGGPSGGPASSYRGRCLVPGSLA